jgi:hypothetical protein
MEAAVRHEPGDFRNSGRRRTQDFQSKLGRNGRNLVQVVVSKTALRDHLKKRSKPAGRITVRRRPGSVPMFLKVWA